MEAVVALLGLMAIGAGAYAAVKADLARAHFRAESAEKSATHAHARLDEHFNLHHSR